MNLSGYLVIKKSEHRYGSGAGSAKFVSKKPTVAANEIAVKIECNIPDELFSRPQLKFQIDIPKEAVPQKEISAEVIGNLKELIQQNTGLTISLISEPI